MQYHALLTALCAVMVHPPHSTCANDSPPSVVQVLRDKRQSFADFIQATSVVSPILFQTNNQIPSTPDQITATRCQSLVGQAPPTGCTYIALLLDASQLPLNCQLQCSENVNTFQLPPVLGQLNSVLPSYLTENRFSVADQSNLDRFVGSSYYLFTSPTTTTSNPANVITSSSTTAPTAIPTNLTPSVGTVVTVTTLTTTATTAPLTSTCTSVFFERSPYVFKHTAGCADIDNVFITLGTVKANGCTGVTYSLPAEAVNLFGIQPTTGDIYATVPNGQCTQLLVTARGPTGGALAAVPVYIDCSVGGSSTCGPNGGGTVPCSIGTFGCGDFG